MFNIVNSTASFRLWIRDEYEGFHGALATNPKDALISIYFTLQAGVAHRRSTATSFCYVSMYRSVPLVCSICRLC
jgi:hypothetical protein